jgi:hypothetical protein
MTDLDRLRVEFPKADLLYVRRAAPAAIKLAERYNARRAAINPTDYATIRAARRAKERLTAAVEA